MVGGLPFLPHVVYSSALKMETANSSEMMVLLSHKGKDISWDKNANNIMNPVTMLLLLLILGSGDQMESFHVYLTQPLMTFGGV
jgi:hypothetical protein